jgi:hypothetical protein
MERFRNAVLAHDADALVAALADDVVLHSPILFKPVIGKPAVGALLRAVMRVLTNFRYVAELSGSGKTALEFQANVDKLELQGIDLIEVDAAGLVRVLTVFMRPLSATQAFLAAMQTQLTIG